MHAPHHSIAEADAHIRALSSLQPVVAVTSDRCQSANIAQVAWELANAGIASQGSVALVDFDASSPQLHRFLQRAPGPGLIEIVRNEQHFADVIDFSLTATSRFVTLTYGADETGASDNLVADAATTIDGLVDLAETVLLIAGPLHTALARDVVARADAVVVVVDGNHHLGWPNGRPAEMAGIATPVIGWVADRGTSLPAEPHSSDAPALAGVSRTAVDLVLDAREPSDAAIGDEVNDGALDNHEETVPFSFTSPATPLPAPSPVLAAGRTETAHRLERLWHRSDEVTPIQPSVSGVDGLPRPEGEPPKERKLFGLLRRSHYLD